MMTKRKCPYLLSLLMLVSSTAWSQHEGHAMDHGDADTGDAAAPAMDHGNMQMQGGSAPADARDPHAYSGGYTLEDGPYALPGPRQLKLADEHLFWAVLGDRLEYDTDSETGEFDLQGWYGSTYNRLALKLEGEVDDGDLTESQLDAQWTHAISAYFDTELGLRFDHYDEGSDRQWLGIGLQGLAPNWFELDVTAYVGNNGRTALSVEAEYELLLTQKLVLQPRAEFAVYGKDDEDNGIGNGLSDGSLGLRLRYEFTRRFAPYIGIERREKFGDTAELARAEGEPDGETHYLLGLHFWF